VHPGQPGVGRERGDDPRRGVGGEGVVGVQEEDVSTGATGEARVERRCLAAVVLEDGENAVSV